MLQPNARRVPGLCEPGGDDTLGVWEVVMHGVDIVPLRESQRSTAAAKTSRVRNRCCAPRWQGSLGCARLRSIQALSSVAYSLHEHSNTNQLTVWL